MPAPDGEAVADARRATPPAAPPAHPRRTPRRGPTLWTTVVELGLLRFRLLGRRLGGTGVIGALLSGLALVSTAGGLGLGGYLLFSRLPTLTRDPLWMAFLLALYFFLLGVFWVLWPLVAAQVDDAAELGRFLHFPVRAGRLYLVQTLVGLVEPSVLFFYPALIGAGFGLAESLRPGAFATVGLMACYAVMCVAVGRALLNLFLNVMVHRRSAEILFSAFLVALAAAALLPPVDTSWLTARFADLAAAGPEDLDEIRKAASAMTDTPPGWLAFGLRAAARGYGGTALRTGLGMLLVAALAWGVGLVAIKRFYRGHRLWRRRARRHPDPAAPGTPTASEADPSPRPEGARPRGRHAFGWSLPGVRPVVAALCERELRTLARSPKGRLLFAMPFFLVILLKLVGAPPLLAHWLGPAWTAQLMTALAVYVLGSLAGQFFVNQFGYDGQAVRLVYLLPPPPRDWLLGRNLAHGAYAVIQILALTALALLLLPGARLTGLAVPLLVFPVGLLVLLAVGNLLSIRHPRRFVFTLNRRDRPAAASFGWLLATLGLTLAAVAGALRLAALAGLPPALGVLALLPVAALGYVRLLPVAARALRVRREALVEGVIES